MAQRFVMNARVIGAVQRDSPKLKMFMLSVMWSDQSEVIVYRSFQDFRKFHRQLKKRFPLLNPFRRKDRVIPKFKGEARKASMQQKGSKRSVRRMRFLENYCAQLLKCDENVTRSSEVTQFFTPKDHDLQTDFTKNSVVVMLAEGEGGAQSRGPVGNVSHPFVTQTYRCVAPYETKDTKNRPFKVSADDKLDVLIKEPTGWWLVENEDKRVAWFPAPYLELLDEDEADDVTIPAGAGSLHIAVRSYSTKKEDEIAVNIGSVVEVLRKSDDGWWFIRFNGKAGYIPSMYLQPYNNPRVGLHSLQTKLHSSTLNLATRGPQTLQTPSIREEEEEPSGRLLKARSLDVLSESWTQREPGPSDGRTRSSSSSSSQGTSLSGFSSESEPSSRESQEEAQSPSTAPPPAPLRRRGSTSSSSTFSSLSSKTSSESGPQAPKVPARPRPEEIMTRCTTMTRKAALASQARLHQQPSAVYAR